MTALRVLGVDPGGFRCGWAIVERTGTRRVYVASGVIKLKRSLPAHVRLFRIHQGISAVIARPWRVPISAACVEDQFPRGTSGLKLAQARGAAAAAIGAAGLPLHEVAPSTLKASIAGNGRASKQQVARCACAMLGIAVPRSEDESDAIAVALHGCTLMSI